jgi:hypothetical protein
MKLVLVRYKVGFVRYGIAASLLFVSAMMFERVSMRHSEQISAETLNLQNRASASDVRTNFDARTPQK